MYSTLPLVPALLMVRVHSLIDMNSKKCLLFHIYGPMESWGGVAVGTFRPTERHPTKSAIVGILAASLGIERFDSERQSHLYSDFEYVVASAGKEYEMSDYATIESSKPDRKETYTVLPPRSLELSRNDRSIILSTKKYICNGFYTVAVIPKKKSLFGLQDLCFALKSPKYIPYLGRKSCPMSYPMSPSVEKYERLFDLLTEKSLAPFKQMQQTSTFLEKHMLHMYSTFRLDTDSVCIERLISDDLPERKTWQFRTRREYEYTEASE